MEVNNIMHIHRPNKRETNEGGTGKIRKTEAYCTSVLLISLSLLPWWRLRAHTTCSEKKNSSIKAFNEERGMCAPR